MPVEYNQSCCSTLPKNIKGNMKYMQKMAGWIGSIYGISMASCQKGSTRHAKAWQIGPFWQDTLDMYSFQTERWNYRDVTWMLRILKLPATPHLYVQQHTQANNKKT